MRDQKEWKGGARASGREEIQLQPGQADLGELLHSSVAERANPGNPGNPGVGAGAHSLERSTVIEGAPMHGLEDEEAAAILSIGSATEPNSGPTQLTFLHNTSLPGHARKIDSGVRDFTQDSLRHARLRAEDLATANRRKDEFLAVLGHELCNPLTSINNGIHLLSHQTQDTPAWQKTQAMIKRQVRRMRQLVDDLLDVSRIAQGRPHLQRERIDLRDAVSNAIETLESDINERRHRLTTALPDAPVWLHADPCRLEQVFVNLLANASRYTDPGGELAVWMHLRDGQAIVRIRDTGIGIAPEALPHIFDLFRQADEAAAYSKSGLGIGLTVVRNLLELHGGSVTAASAGLGQGSEFTVCLPSET